MLCDTCTNRRFCENEERQMCIANGYDRYDDDGSVYSPSVTTYDNDIDATRTVFEAMLDEETKGSQALYNACKSIYTIIDRALGDMLLMNCIHAIENCVN